jgi:hypothetical protein
MKELVLAVLDNERKALAKEYVEGGMCASLRDRINFLEELRIKINRAMPASPTQA